MKLKKGKPEKNFPKAKYSSKNEGILIKYEDSKEIFIPKTEPISVGGKL